MDGGAENAAAYPGMLSVDLKSPRALKVVLGVSAIVAITGLIASSAMEFPAPTTIPLEAKCRDFITAEGSSVPCRVAFDIAAVGYARNGMGCGFRSHVRGDRGGLGRV